MLHVARVVGFVAVFIATTAAADTRASATKEGVALTIFRAPDKAILCLSTQAPVHLSGEFGIHASWSGRAASQAKPIELYSKQDYFTTPVRLELPLPPEARLVRVEVGACIANESCDAVEFKYDLRRLTPSPDRAPASCAP
jgi:hypothetical protein